MAAKRPLLAPGPWVLLCGWMLVLPAAGAAGAQDPSAAMQLRRVVEDCRPVALLKAAGGGGRQELTPGAEIRVPYGVPYLFYHRVEDADFVLLRLEVAEGPSPVIEAVRVRGDTTCFTAALPELPMDRAVTLVESRGVRPSAAERAGMVAALDELRSGFLARLFGGAYGEAIGAGRLREAVAEEFATLVDTAAFVGFAVRDRAVPGGTRPLLEVVRSGFADRVGVISRTPFDVSRATSLIGAIETIRESRGRCASSRMTPGQQQALIRLQDRLAPLKSVLPEDYARLYAGGTLPLDPALLEGFAATVRAACPELGDSQLEVLTRIAVALTRNELAPVLEAIRAAARLVEESYRIVAVDGFAGATTTLQRFGQLDVVNAYFLGREEARLLATFNFYPLALRFGGEIRPHGQQDRLLASIGYSFATPVADDDGADPPTAFTAGLSYRLNEIFALGGGGWFMPDDDGFYLSLAGDLGAIPLLRELFARLPKD